MNPQDPKNSINEMALAQLNLAANRSGVIVSYFEWVRICKVSSGQKVKSIRS